MTFDLDFVHVQALEVHDGRRDSLRSHQPEHFAVEPFGVGLQDVDAIRAGDVENFELARLAAAPGPATGAAPSRDRVRPARPSRATPAV